MLDSSYLNQDLRKGRSNTITNYPYGTANAFPVAKVDETLTPSIM